MKKLHAANTSHRKIEMSTKERQAKDGSAPETTKQLETAEQKIARVRAKLEAEEQKYKTLTASAEWVAARVEATDAAIHFLPNILKGKRQGDSAPAGERFLEWPELEIQVKEAFSGYPVADDLEDWFDMRTLLPEGSVIGHKNLQPPCPEVMRARYAVLKAPFPTDLIFLIRRLQRTGSLGQPAFISRITSGLYCPYSFCLPELHKPSAYTSEDWALSGEAFIPGDKLNSVPGGFDRSKPSNIAENLTLCKLSEIVGNAMMDVTVAGCVCPFCCAQRDYLVLPVELFSFYLDNLGDFVRPRPGASPAAFAHGMALGTYTVRLNLDVLDIANRAVHAVNSPVGQERSILNKLAELTNAANKGTLNTALTKDAEDAKKKATELTKTIQKLQDELAFQHKKEESLAASAKAQDHSRKRAEEDLRAAKKVIDSLKGQHDQAMEKNADLEKVIEKLSASIAALTDEIERLTSDGFTMAAKEAIDSQNDLRQAVLKVVMQYADENVKQEAQELLEEFPQDSEGEDDDE